MRRLPVPFLLIVAAGLTTAQTICAQRRPRQSVRLVGRVIDQTRHLIPGVEVVFNGDEVRSTTSASGVFQLQILPSDSTVGFRRIGYRPLVVRVDPLPPIDDTLLVELESVPIQLAEVTVVGTATKPLRYAGTTKYDEVFLRKQVGLGKLITREDIDQHFGLHTEELLGTVPGIHVWNGPPKRVRFVRCQDPKGIAVFIDGTRQLQLIASASRTPDARTDDEPVIETLSRINPADIEMIEVFRGPSEIPGVYHWDGCAVIAIWTRWNK